MHNLETSIQTICMITRLSRLISQLESEITVLDNFETELKGHIELNKRMILRSPLGAMTKRLWLENKKFKCEILKCRERISKYQKKLEKNKFLRKSKLTNLAEVNVYRNTPVSSSCPIEDAHFDWDEVLKFVN